MIPDTLAQYLTQHQNVLWLMTLLLDLALTVVRYRLFGRRGLMAAVVLSGIDIGPIPHCYSIKTFRWPLW